MSTLQQEEDEINTNNNGQIESYSGSGSQQNQFEIYATNKAQQNRDKIDTIYQRFTSAINEYMKNYVQSKLDTESFEKNKDFINSQLTVDTLTQKMQTLSYNIQNDTVTLNKNMSGLKTKIQNEETMQQNLINNYSYNIPIDNTSSLMINNSIENYKSQYISNWIMFIGIIIIFICLVKLF
jgi:hypothetical protein